jgi:phosphopantetheine--protein transferase-like protein
LRWVGNDIVDLEDPAIAQSHLRERFVARVCSESEQALIASALAPKRLLWSLFAAKEAAFKAISKSRALVFAHRKFVVSADLRSVTYGQQVLWLWVEGKGACIHAIAWTDDEMPIFGMGEISEGVDPSAAGRALLLTRLGVPGLSVERDPTPGSWNGFGPPRLFRDGVEVNLDISLSHDGRFVGFAADSSGAEKR